MVLTAGFEPRIPGGLHILYLKILYLTIGPDQPNTLISIKIWTMKDLNFVCRSTHNGPLHISWQLGISVRRKRMEDRIDQDFCIYQFRNRQSEHDHYRSDVRTTS